MTLHARLFADISALYDARRYAEALPLGRRLLAATPDRVDALNVLGSLLLALEQPAAALTYFDRATRLAPGIAVVSQNRAKALHRLGRLDEALAAFAEARRLAPHAVAVIDQMMLAHLEAGQREAAIALMRERVRLAPAEARGWRNLGLLLRDDGRLAEALGAFRRALELTPDSTDARRAAVYGTRTLLGRLHLFGRGIEIGAFCNPLELPEGVTVRYVDSFDTAELYRRFPEHADRTIVEVEVVDDGETLGSFAAASEDFIVANHLLEHCQDPIGTLINMLRVVRPGGVLFLAVPDKRYTFDEPRPLTGFAHLLRDHREGPDGSRMDHFREWARLVKKVPEQQVDAAAAALHETPDMVHYHVWDHHAFTAFLLQAREACALPFELVESCANGRYESIAILRRR